MKLYLQIVGHTGLALVALWVASHATAVATQSDSKTDDLITVNLTGSVAVIDQVQAAVRLFSDASLSIEFAKSEDADSVDKLLSGASHVAVLTRSPNESELQLAEERQLKFESVTIGSGGIAIIVHPTIGRALPSIGMDQLRSIFVDGTITNWNQLCSIDGPIEVICPPVSSGLSETFIRTLMNHTTATDQMRYFDQARIAEHSGKVVEIVAKNPQAIGLVASTIPADGLAKLPVEFNGQARHCNESSIRQLNYPFIYEFNAVCRLPRQGRESELLGFFASAAGQQALHNAGLITSMEIISLKPESRPVP